MRDKEEQCGCDWLTPPKVQERLIEYGEKEDEDICSQRIECVPLDQIAIPRPWKPERLEDIRKWATEQNLTSAEIEVEIEGHWEGVDSFRLPRLAREYPGKYTIADGIHRVNRAKELGLHCILAHVEDCYKVKKE